MGLMDKLAAKMAARGPDHAVLLTEALGPDDAFVAFGHVTPSAYERGGGGGNDLAGRLLNKAVDAATNAVSSGRHVGGGPDSIAQSLPKDGNLTFAALSARGISLWSFGITGTDVPPTFLLRINGDHVASVVDTGTKAQGGTHVVRFTFSDASFFDYRIHPTHAGFLTGCLERWPA